MGNIILLLALVSASNSADIAPVEYDEFAAVQTVSKAMDGLIGAQDGLEKAKSVPGPASLAQQQALTAKIEDQKAGVEATASQFKDSAKVQTSAANFWVMAGDNQKAFGHADAAVKAAEKHLTNPRNLADALQARALAEAAAGDTDRARADARQVLKMYPDDEGALLIAQMAERDGRNIPGTLSINGKRVRPPDSVRGRATGVMPGRPDAGRVSAGGRGGGAHGEPVEFEEQVGVVNWQRVAASIVVHKRAIEALARQDYPAMHSYAAQATALFPQNVNAARAAAFASAMLGHNQDALAEVSGALSLKSEAPELLALRAQVNNQLGRPDEALRDALHAIANDPKQGAAWLQKGLAREKLGQPSGNYLPDLEKAAELEPSFQSFYREALARRNQGGGSGRAESDAQAPPLGSVARMLWELDRMLPDEKANPGFYYGLWAFNGFILVALVFLTTRLLRR